jgi:hypothetical protein
MRYSISQEAAGLTSGNVALKLFAGELLAMPLLQFAAFVQEPSVWPVQVVATVPAESWSAIDTARKNR